MEELFQVVNHDGPTLLDRNDASIIWADLDEYRSLIRSRGIDVSGPVIKAFWEEKLKELEKQYKQELLKNKLEEKKRCAHLPSKVWVSIAVDIQKRSLRVLKWKREEINAKMKRILWAAGHRDVHLAVYATLWHGTETECTIVADNEECGICLLMVKGQWGHFQCGHHACMSCINEWFNQTDNCPECQVTVSELHVYSRE